MFEQSLVEVRALSARPWTMAVSLAGQGILIAAAILTPLMYPEVLQRAAFWMPVTGPPQGYRPPAPSTVEPVRTASRHRVFDPHTIFQPAAVPARIAMVEDEPAPVTGGSSGPCVGCVFGGIDAAGPPLAVLTDIASLPAPIAQQPAQPVVKPPQPPAPKQIKTSSGVQAALLIYGPQPVYPPLARQARVSGVVRLAALIGTDGRMVDLRVTSGHPLLAKAALDAVKQWVYRPTLLSGSPVEVVTEITVTFTLN
jgi:periplasmic protein TonB